MKHADLSWKEVERLTARLATNLAGCIGGEQDQPSFDRVIGVARGGLIPAALLATLLDVKCVETIQVCLYEGSRRLPEPRVTGVRPASAGPSGDPKRTILVDEILDSGTTLTLLRELYPEACMAVLLGRHAAERGQARGGLIAYPLPAIRGGPEADSQAEPAAVVWVAESVAGSEWVLFPWSPAEDRPEAT